MTCRILKLFAIFLSWTSLAHAGTEIATFPGNQKSEPYASVLIEFRGNLKDKHDVENSFVQAFSKKSASRFLADVQLFSPLEKSPPAARPGRLRESGVAAVLSLQVLAVRQSLRTYYEPGFDDGYGFGYGFGHHHHPFFGFSRFGFGGREVVETVWSWNTKIELQDLRSGRVVWMAEAETDGTSRREIIRSLTKRVVKEVVKAGLVEKR